MTRDRQIVKSRVATTHRVAKYGGFRLSEEALQELAEHHRTHPILLCINHDPMRDLHARVLGVEVVDLEDGEKAVDVEFEVDTDGWQEFEAECNAAGVKVGAMSYSTSEALGVVQSTRGNAHLSIAADAGDFSDEAIWEAAERLAQLGDVEAHRLYQFGAESICRVIIEFASSGLAGVAWSMFSSALYDAAKNIYGRRKQPTESELQIEFRVKREPDGTHEQILQIRTTHPEMMNEALEKMVDCFSAAAPRMYWDDESTGWTSK